MAAGGSRALPVTAATAQLIEMCRVVDTVLIEQEFDWSREIVLLSGVTVTG